MIEGNISQKYRLKDIDGPRNYFLEEIGKNELMSRKHKNVCATINYIDHLFILASAITGCFGFQFFLFA